MAKPIDDSCVLARADEKESWSRRLTEWVAEGFYADPGNGGFNPVLTIMALAFRNAAEIARRL